jgi:AcrR family transcriptional regulator
MNNSHSSKPAPRRLSPRKTPSQPRSVHTVETILEGAAHILERLGLEGYTTNAIAAHAGVSIGSLYQYFPTKDAVTIALIERESAGIAHEVIAALALDDRRRALRLMIEIAVRYQLRRPRLAVLLDFEQHRLSALMPSSSNAVAVHQALARFLDGGQAALDLPSGLAASELMAMIGALTDAAGRRADSNQSLLADRIEAAVLGYLRALENPVSPAPP